MILMSLMFYFFPPELLPDFPPPELLPDLPPPDLPPFDELLPDLPPFDFPPLDLPPLLKLLPPDLPPLGFPPNLPSPEMDDVPIHRESADQMDRRRIVAMTITVCIFTVVFIVTK